MFLKLREEERREGREGREERRILCGIPEKFAIESRLVTTFNTSTVHHYVRPDRVDLLFFHQPLTCHYRNLSKIHPWAMNLSGSSKGGGGGRIFESYISLKNTLTSHAVSPALVMYCNMCSDSAMPLLSCTYLCDNSKCCLPSFLCPSSYTTEMEDWKSLVAGPLLA